jgi:hypothetical protein
MDEREHDEPDLSEDPRKKGVGDQMPEENPEGQVPGEGGDGPQSGAGGAEAPDTSHPEEGDPGQATGNPDAAG